MKREVRCWRCHTINSPSAKRCRECRSVAFYSGRRMPAWPPIFSQPYVDKDGDTREMQLYGAFLEGDIPHGPELSRLAPRHERQIAKRAGTLRVGAPL